MTTALKTGMVTGIIALAEGIAVGNIHEHRPFSRSTVNINAGCKTAMSNVIMSIAVMFTLLFLTPLFHYTPLLVLSAIIISAMLVLVDYDAASHLWNVDKFDFLVCIGVYISVIFASVKVGLVIAVVISVLRLLLFVARPRTFIQGNLLNSTIYRNVEHYPNANIIQVYFSTIFHLKI
ncbi:Detected protein of unknown function [Hibiscus syriacus]|uniref:SLC26A/SulP transporter domain-containing protein n=1 Tax=Hibiscus syriacus TaxID=106335 RepID=A0A6A2Z287_HIBSY|nr:Detected protein of unknown function [Hibiscus syriacus]